MATAIWIVENAERHYRWVMSTTTYPLFIASQHLDVPGRCESRCLDMYVDIMLTFDALNGHMSPFSCIC
jgi:hypothetical protein